jgi:Txe/YoeB family toxin of Txe-Axe toxin-antitoxin module
MQGLVSRRITGEHSFVDKVEGKKKFNAPFTMIKDKANKKPLTILFISYLS